MSRRRHVEALEGRLRPADTGVVFVACRAPAGLSAAAHEAWHAARGDGERCFTLKLGAADVHAREA